MTSSQDHGTRGGTRLHVSAEELFREVPPIGSIDELAAPGVFDTDTELDEFLASVRTDRDTDLA